MLNDFYELNIELTNIPMLGMLPLGVMPANDISIAVSGILETAPPPF